jgi:hypothetical protein
MTEVYFTCKRVNFETLTKEKAAAAAREQTEQTVVPVWTN